MREPALIESFEINPATGLPMTNSRGNVGGNSHDIDL